MTFSLAAGHVQQVAHRVCFVIESNKQDKLDSKQWKEGRASQEISGSLSRQDALLSTALCTEYNAQVCVKL